MGETKLENISFRKDNEYMVDGQFPEGSSQITKVSADIPQNFDEVNLASPIPEPLSGSETAELVAEIYEAAGPRVGSLLVESNVVLTLAGARGMTELNIFAPVPEDREKFKRLNELLTDRIYFDDEYFGISHGTETRSVQMHNFPGYHRVSRASKLPGVIPFMGKSMDALIPWERQMLDNLHDVIQSGLIPGVDTSDLLDIYGGIIRGYPDIAILDLFDANDPAFYPSAEAPISQVKLYGGARPNFDLRPEHLNNPTVQGTVTLWDKILGDFYAHPWHKKISQDSQFKETRIMRNQRKI